MYPRGSALNPTGSNEEAAEAAKLALELGNDINARDANGDTAVHGALYRGSREVIQFLAEHGANLDSVNAYGWTPLTIAEGVWYPNTYKSERDLIPVLRQLGARNPGKRRAIDLTPSEIDGLSRAWIRGPVLPLAFCRRRHPRPSRRHRRRRRSETDVDPFALTFATERPTPFANLEALR